MFVMETKDYKEALKLADELYDETFGANYIHWINLACWWDYNDQKDLSKRLAKIVSLNRAQVFENPHQLLLEALIENKTITKIHFDVFFHSSLLSSHFIKYLANNKSLRHLDLSSTSSANISSMLHRKHAKILAEALKVNTTLKFLDIAEQNLEKEGVLCILDALIANKNNTIEHLNLFGNDAKYKEVVDKLTMYKKMPHCKLKWTNL